MSYWQDVLQKNGIPSETILNTIVAKHSIYELIIEDMTVSGIPCAFVKEGGRDILIGVSPIFAIDQFKELLALPSYKQPKGFIPPLRFF